MTRLAGTIGLVLTLALITNPNAGCVSNSEINDIAEGYVKLALKVGQYIPDYIDAYNGPEEWKPPVLGPESSGVFPYKSLSLEAEGLINSLSPLREGPLNQSQAMRASYLAGQLNSLRAMLEIRNGKKMTFDEESRALYGVVAPEADGQIYDSILKEMDRLLPGSGSLADRNKLYRSQFEIPRDKIDTLMKLAIAECRRRTSRFIDLPDSESFDVELVSGNSWGAYNWYKGNLHSLIQIETDLPVYAGNIIGLAAHEGYPGHHVSNILLDKNYVQDSGWVEFTIYILFSPQSVLEEGMAEYGIDLVFPPEDQAAFLKTVIFPVAGLDSSKAEEYLGLSKLRQKLGPREITTARLYLDGILPRESAIDSLRYYHLITVEEAKSCLDFYDKYRSYIITYHIGKSLLNKYIAGNGGDENDPQKKWELYLHLKLGLPNPADLQD